MQKINIKQIKTSELPRVIYITKLAYKIPYKENTLITVSHESEDIKDKFKNKEFFVLAAKINSKIIAVVRYKLLDNNLYFYKLAVLKTYRRKGIAVLLINYLEKTAKQKKCKKILLDCAQEKKLPEYYQKLNYKIDKIKKHYDHHDVYMSKKIN